MLIVLLIIAIFFIVISTSKLKLHPFLALIIAAIGYGLFSGIPLDSIITSVNNGFGSTVGSIGIVIVAGCIIGVFLEESGGAYIMARSVMKVAGEKRVPLVMLLLGYIISIPVFADSGFVIMNPLNKALSKKAGISLAGTAIALSLGLTITHCLVPPTPGPIAATSILGADLGLVILVGLIVSLFSLVIAYIFVSKYVSRTYIDPAPNQSDHDIEEKVKNAPSAVKSFLPIVVPLLLIVLKSVSDFPTNPFGTGNFKAVMGFIGEPVMALLIGVALALLLPKKFDLEMLSTTGWVGKALVSAAVIIMITAAGGSFGMVLRDSGIADVVGDSFSGSHLGIWMPFLIAAALKTAQGSSTVAIITAASIIAPLMTVMGFVTPMEKALAVMAVCSGAMVVSHVNDSFFWVITQMTGMSVRQGYRFHTLGTLLCGTAAMLAVWLIYSIAV
ncbi:MAG: GntP family permease [Bacteroidaceae bacterium]|jgi:GntP family gluconate:H+ symporter|nr:GntP family permease [Bacteroidaceae bacterium]OPZ47756.1 MAG: Inner membrane permease YgbN [Bacteroidetes bacterium ADurb.BinA104]MBP8602847.1 GntP family permease [Bacteroidaceae bacterium]HOD68640.1 GntP family permease [Bacteroidaceae bacterium]HPB03733.1 GntP family permease [Bacteroidaceae bacterium]